METVRAAGPQTHALDWTERYPGPGPALVFRVTRLSLTEDGWTADIAIDNRSGAPWELPEAPEAFRRQFGLMLFDTGDLAELDRLNSDQALPPVRKAERFSPAFPTFLADGKTWSISPAAVSIVVSSRAISAERSGRILSDLRVKQVVITVR